MKKTVITMLLTTAVTFALTIGETPKPITLSKENGSCANGEDWNSSMLIGKTHLLLYVDPDKKGDNEAFLDTLKSKQYDPKVFSMVAIINLEATWLPNFAIEKKLKAQQEKFPNTLYVKDKTKYLVKEWKLADDNSNIVLFDKEGKVIYTHVGEMNEDEMKKVFSLIEENIK